MQSSMTILANTTADEPQSPRSAKRRRGFKEHGCEHYKRRCRLVAPCCDKEFWCRHCHNEYADNLSDPKQRHQLDRTAVTEVVCALCSMRQPLAAECSSCGVRFGEYTCLKCAFFDDDVSKSQFHCDGCGICRVGGAENFFHCPTCGCCYHESLKDKHTCVEKSMHHNCPICFEYLFDSTKPTSVLRCGHTLHSQCLSEMQERGHINCPTCLKTIANMQQVWRTIDEEVRVNPMPPEYAGWQSEICCHEGCPDAVVPFHALALKCPMCGGYNTRSLRLIKPPRQGSHETNGNAGSASTSSPDPESS